MLNIYAFEEIKVEEEHSAIAFDFSGHAHSEFQLGFQLFCSALFCCLSQQLLEQHYILVHDQSLHIHYNSL
jgi:hypothetical protein